MPTLSLASTSIPTFHTLLTKNPRPRILALCGAGLSAASGLDTFRGAGGMWKNYQATSLATPEAFERDPGLVWLFYSMRRHRALQAKPNKGHFALAELARRLPEDFITLTQNVDGLSQRAHHPRASLKLLHDSIFDIKCFSCDYREMDNFDDPFHPSLAIHSSEELDQKLASAKNTIAARAAALDPNTPPTIPIEDLPHCPKCKIGLLRPGVVWFGESLPEDTLTEVDNWINDPQYSRIDICLVIGTTATVYPAASYINTARYRGARIVVVNSDAGELGAASSLRKGDFLFLGDAARILPEILEPLVGDLKGMEGVEGVGEV
ncbi:DHS-like NAD/FAD-binding domain-containing protein [Tricladium varicosporioides]|nr:DHS-like NAD/FAD-binding domain-containing protein [Hymenoscyphus varicosporioides]